MEKPDRKTRGVASEAIHVPLEKTAFTFETELPRQIDVPTWIPRRWFISSFSDASGVSKVSPARRNHQELLWG
jgi:hypothetical protein